MKSIAKYYKEIQNSAWAKHYSPINFKNNQIHEKSSTILIVEDIEALREYEK